ncbi:MAG: YtxH domain-containing protein [Spirochaetota bacterium]|nr:YtxH domain-containing protein [Spirochaetota bacterium]
MKNKSELLVSFLAGTLIGAGIALLLAPQSGVRTRESIKKISKEMKDTMNLTRFVKDI